jgi:hypothetical protein
MRRADASAEQRVICWRHRTTLRCEADEKTGFSRSSRDSLVGLAIWVADDTQWFPYDLFKLCATMLQRVREKARG